MPSVRQRSIARELRAKYLPADVVQHLLVDRMAQAQWQLSRAQRLQAAALNLLAGWEDPSDPDTRIVAAMRATNSDVISTLARYAAQAERSFHKAHREINAAKQRQLEAVCRPRLSMADMRRILKETPRVAHPSRPRPRRTKHP